jgi:hypothetical protein
MLIMLSGILANVINPECHFAECRYASALTDIAKKRLTHVQYGKINKFENIVEAIFCTFFSPVAFTIKCFTIVIYDRNETVASTITQRC